MSKRPELRIVDGSGAPDAKDGASAGAGRDPRSLLRLDWIAAGCLIVALILAPLLAGSFATPPREAFLSDTPLAMFAPFGIPLVMGLAALAFLVTAWREWKRPVAMGAVPGLGAAAILLGAWASLSLARSSALYMSLNALTLLLSALLMGGLAGRLARDRNGLAALLLAVIFAGFLTAGFGINEYLTHWKQGDLNHRTFATFANPDFLAGYLLLTLPLTLAAFAATTARPVRLLFALFLLVQSACLLLTGSRAGVGVLLIALVFWFLLAAASGAAKGKWFRIAAGLAIFVVGATLAAAPTRSRVVGDTPAASAGAHAAATTAGASRGSASAPAGNAGTLSAMEATADAQSHSSAFRRYTWIGTFKMAAANPILGTGIGTFEIAYPRYAETAFTAHAHNGYLQFAGETGVPGLLFLLSALAAATAFAAFVLFLRRRRHEEAEASSMEPWTAKEDRAAPGLFTQLAFDSPHLLLTGLFASIAASLMHNLIDSDWYIAATAVTLCAVVALLTALARDIAPLATQTPRPMARGLMAGGLLIAAFLLWRAYGTGTARYEETAGMLAMSGGNGAEAMNAYRAAVSADPFDPEPHLDMAQIDQAIQRPEEAHDELETAARIAPIGKTLYRLGQFYSRAGASREAVAAFTQSRAREPHNLQNLRALAETLAQTGDHDRAREAYHAMTALEHKPYGTVRAMPEVVETDFAFAHAGLGDLDLQTNQLAQAASEYAQADTVLREYWRRRNEPMMETMTAAPQKRAALADLYDSVLTHWQEALTKQGQAAEAARVHAEQEQVSKQRSDDTLAEQGAGGTTP